MTVTFLLLLCLCPVGQSWHDENYDYAGDYDYHRFPAIAGDTTRLECMEHIPELRQPKHLKRIYFKWYFKGEEIDFKVHRDKWLAEDNRTLVVESVDVNNIGLYKCACLRKKDGRRCRVHKKPLIMDRMELHLAPLFRYGYCDWEDDLFSSKEPVAYLRPKYHFTCSCFGGLENVCGSKMLMQRQDRQTKEWIDIPFGYRDGAVSFFWVSKLMTISGKGSNLTFEEAGKHRCIAVDDDDYILCETKTDKNIEADFPPKPIQAPSRDREHLLWYGAPLAVVTGLIFLSLVAAIIHFRCTTRVVVEANDTYLIRKVVPSAPHDGPEVADESSSSLQSEPDESALYPDLGAISTIF